MEGSEDNQCEFISIQTEINMVFINYLEKMTMSVPSSIVTYENSDSFALSNESFNNQQVFELPNSLSGKVDL